MSLRLSGELTALPLALLAPNVDRSVAVFRVGDWCVHEVRDKLGISHVSGLSAASGLEFPHAMLLLHSLQELPTCPASIAELRRQRAARAYAPEVQAWVDAVQAKVSEIKGYGLANQIAFTTTTTDEAPL